MKNKEIQIAITYLEDLVERYRLAGHREGVVECLRKIKRLRVHLALLE